MAEFEIFCYVSSVLFCVSETLAFLNKIFQNFTRKFCKATLKKIAMLKKKRLLRSKKIALFKKKIATFKTKTKWYWQNKIVAFSSLIRTVVDDVTAMMMVSRISRRWQRSLSGPSRWWYPGFHADYCCAREILSGIGLGLESSQKKFWDSREISGCSWCLILERYRSKLHLPMFFN